MFRQGFPPSPYDESTITDATSTPPSYAFSSKVTMGAVIVFIVVISFGFLFHFYANWLLRRPRSASRITGRRAIAFVSRGITFVLPVASTPAHINTGLDKATIAQLPTFLCKPTPPVDNVEAGKFDESVPEQAPSLECAICLSKFQHNEKGRMLPSCQHKFHTECIDTWLFSHSTCPLCRANIMPAMANAPETTATHEQHPEGEEQEAIEASPGTERSPVVSNAVEQPCHVLVQGDQAHVIMSQEPSSSSLPLLQSSGMPRAGALPQITIDIPPIQGNILLNASGAGHVSAKCTTEEEASSSQPLNSSFGTSTKRMLSRQSSRQKSFTQQEDLEGPPKVKSGCCYQTA